MMDNNTEHRHKRRVYLDNSATTQPYPEVILKMGQVMYDTYGNPSSQHSAGHDARITVEQARRTIASLTGALPSEIFFTSGGVWAYGVLSPRIQNTMPLPPHLAPLLPKTRLFYRT